MMSRGPQSALPAESKARLVATLEAIEKQGTFPETSYLSQLSEHMRVHAQSMSLEHAALYLLTHYGHVTRILCDCAQRQWHWDHDPFHDLGLPEQMQHERKMRKSWIQNCDRGRKWRDQLIHLILGFKFEPIHVDYDQTLHFALEHCKIEVATNADVRTGWSVHDSARGSHTSTACAPTAQEMLQTIRGHCVFPNALFIPQLSTQVIATAHTIAIAESRSDAATYLLTQYSHVVRIRRICEQQQRLRDYDQSHVLASSEQLQQERQSHALTVENCARGKKWRDLLISGIVSFNLLQSEVAHDSRLWLMLKHCRTQLGTHILQRTGWSVQNTECGALAWLLELDNAAWLHEATSTLTPTHHAKLQAIARDGTFSESWFIGHLSEHMRDAALKFSTADAANFLLTHYCRMMQVLHQCEQHQWRWDYGTVARTAPLQQERELHASMVENCERGKQWRDLLIPMITSFHFQPEQVQLEQDQPEQVRVARHRIMLSALEHCHKQYNTKGEQRVGSSVQYTERGALAWLLELEKITIQESSSRGSNAQSAAHAAASTRRPLSPRGL